MPSLIRARTAAALTLAVAFTIALTACIGASSSENEAGDDPTTTSDPTGTPGPDVEARARSYLLTLDDFPAGWTEAPPDPEPDYPDYPGDIPSECEPFVEDEELPGTLIEVDSDEFNLEDGGSVDSSATILESVQAAADAFTLVRRLTSDCKEAVEDLLMFYFEHEAAEEVEAGDPPEQVEIIPLEATFEEMAFPVYGDETYATRITMVAQYGEVTVPVNVDSIAIRVGDAVASFTFTYNLFTIINPPEHEQELAGILEQRLLASAP